jgi:hypothetical protein
MIALWIAIFSLLFANLGLLLRLRRLERRVEANADRHFVAPPASIIELLVNARISGDSGDYVDPPITMEEFRQFMDRPDGATTPEQVAYERLVALRRRLEDERYERELAAIRQRADLTVRR